MTPGAKCLA